ncbi:hypothetical protein EVAR_25387_1 [Eumeta japonica]|uniref:Uncharacterized protein n=1 Tax=Eumeta variegata TaxID=151549 RepID=A0A4C1V5Y5_EUMVA|nr:hypothetical protein EVAR_25387_1 [Eumeta japonica]
MVAGLVLRMYQSATCSRIKRFLNCELKSLSCQFVTGGQANYQPAFRLKADSEQFEEANEHAIFRKVTAAHGHSQPHRKHRCVGGVLNRNRISDGAWSGLMGLDHRNSTHGFNDPAGEMCPPLRFSLKDLDFKPPRRSRDQVRSVVGNK